MDNKLKEKFYNELMRRLSDLVVDKLAEQMNIKKEDLYN